MIHFEVRNKIKDVIKKYGASSIRICLLARVESEIYNNRRTKTGSLLRETLSLKLNFRRIE